MRDVLGFMCVLALGLMGCSEASGTGGSGGIAGMGGDGGTGGTDECAGAADGTQCSAGACLESVCSALTTVSGTVTMFQGIDPEEEPAADATVLVLGTSLSTTTNDRGEFSFDVFPGDWFFQTSKEETWGLVEARDVPTEGQSALGLGVLSDALVAQWEQDLRAQDPMADIDHTKGIVAVIFSQTSGLGGETATLSELHRGSFVESGGIAVESDTLPPAVGPDQDLFFYGVDLTEELTVIPMGIDGVNTCDLKVPGTVYPVNAKFATVVEAACMATR